MSLQIGLLDYMDNEYPLHKHGDYEILTYLSGAGSLHVPGQELSVKAGDIVVMPPGTVHGTTPREGLKSIYLNGALNQVFHFSSPVIVSDNSEREGRLLANMIYNNRYEDADYLAALRNAFMHFILRNIKMEDNMELSVRKMMQAITENFYDSNLDLCSLLRGSGYAEDYIRAHFKRITGKTPNAFLTNARIGHACYLIDVYKNTLSLAEIAERCGYTDYVYFSRKFKAVKGMSPRKYRSSL